MAAIAAGVAVAATAASVGMQAYSASQGPGSSSSSTTIAPPGDIERRMRQAGLQGLVGQRDATQDAAFQTNLISPYLYQLAGLQAEYDPASIDAAATARGEYDASATAMSAAEQKKLDAQAMRITKGEGRKVRRQSKKARKQALKETEKGRVQARNTMDAAAQARARAEQAAGRITGLKPIAGKNGAPALGNEDDQTIDALLSGRVKSALQGGTSDDPRLLASLRDEESNLRSRLLRSEGSDYETGTPGMEALRSFSEKKSALLSDYARRDITEFEPLRLNQRESLARNAAAQQQLALNPIAAKSATAASFGSLTNNIANFGRYMQADRLGAPSNTSTGPDTGAADMAALLGKAGAGVGGLVGSGVFPPSATSTQAGVVAQPGQFSPYPSTIGGYNPSAYNLY